VRVGTGKGEEGRERERVKSRGRENESFIPRFWMNLPQASKTGSCKRLQYYKRDSAMRKFKRFQTRRECKVVCFERTELSFFFSFFFSGCELGLEHEITVIPRVTFYTAIRLRGQKMHIADIKRRIIPECAGDSNKRASKEFSVL